jgi:4-aminobutyrate aminotransferase-like enzyme
MHQGFNTKSRYLLAATLANLAPEHLNRVSFTVGGGPAIEAAMKIALKNVSGAKNFCSLWDAYHGSTFTAAGASWTSTKASGKFTGMANFISNLDTNFVRLPNPYCYRCYFNQKPEHCSCDCMKFARLMIEKGVTGQVAGIIVEPLQASGGQIPVTKKYLEEMRRLCDDIGALLIYDEIQTYIRIGEWFAAGYYDVEPDIIVLGKAIGGGLPLAAIIIHDRLKGFEMSAAEELHTFANNSAAQVTALKQIEIVQRDNLLEHTREIGGYLGNRLNTMKKKHPQIGDVRQVGLHIGVEMIEPDTGKCLNPEKAEKIRSTAMAKGMILGTGGYRKHLLKIKPPLILNQREADEILSIFDATLEDVFR